MNSLFLSELRLIDLVVIFVIILLGLRDSWMAHDEGATVFPDLVFLQEEFSLGRVLAVPK